MRPLRWLIVKLILTRKKRVMQILGSTEPPSVDDVRLLQAYIKALQFDSSAAAKFSSSMEYFRWLKRHKDTILQYQREGKIQ